MTGSDIFSQRRELAEMGVVGENALTFIDTEAGNLKIARMGKPVLFIFPVPERDSVYEKESSRFYAKTANSLTALRHQTGRFGISYMITGRGTVNYITSPQFSSNREGTISALRNAGILQSLGVKGSENMMVGIDPFIAYDGDSIIGKVVLKRSVYRNKMVRGVNSFFSFLFSKDYYYDTDIWPLYEPIDGTSFMNSVLESSAEVQRRIAEGLNGRMHIMFNFRPIAMNINSGTVQIARRIHPPPPIWSSSPQRRPISNNLTEEEEKTLQMIKSEQFRRDRKKNAYQVEVQIFAVYPRDEPEDEWNFIVEEVADKASGFYDVGRPLNEVYSIPHASFAKAEVSLGKQPNRNPLYLYARNEFYEGKPGENLGRVESNRAVSVQEAARMFPITSQETISNLRIIGERGRVNTLPALEWLHERVFAVKPDPEIMVDGYGERVRKVGQGRKEGNE